MNETTFVDKTITCRDCGKEFGHSAEAQAFFAEKGFTDPVRCKPCRIKHKAKKEAQKGGEYR